MKKLLLCMVCTWALFSLNAQDQIVGIWKTVDDETGEIKSHVEISKDGDEYIGKVIKLLLKPEDTLCTECKGAKKDQKIVGMEILSGLQTYKDYWSYGKILDPANGKEYKCSAWMEGDDTIVLRGYIGISALGRSQKWHRVN